MTERPRFRGDTLPDLKLNLFAIDLDGLYFEVHADRGYVASVERVVGEPQQETALADTWRGGDD